LSTPFFKKNKKIFKKVDNAEILCYHFFEVIVLNIYSRIKNRRIELGMTQQELAFKVGLKTKGAICRIEAGERDIVQSQINAFAKALETTPAYLMGWEESPINELSEPIIDDVLVELLADLSDLTDEERAKVSAFIQGLKANR
jgi:transcriptional regulator with XRE-family HTH domain